MQKRDVESFFAPNFYYPAGNARTNRIIWQIFIHYAAPPNAHKVPNRYRLADKRVHADKTVAPDVYFTDIIGKCCGIIKMSKNFCSAGNSCAVPYKNMIRIQIIKQDRMPDKAVFPDVNACKTQQLYSQCACQKE